MESLLPITIAPWNGIGQELVPAHAKKAVLVPHLVRDVQDCQLPALGIPIASVQITSAILIAVLNAAAVLQAVVIRISDFMHWQV